MSEINCYLVFLRKPVDNNFLCKNSSGDPVFSADFAAGMYPSGAQVVVDAPAGPGQTLYLVGLSSIDSSQCEVPFGPNMSKSSYSAPFVLGSQSIDLQPGINEVDIVVSLSSQGRFDTCDGIGPPSVDDGTDPDPEAPVSLQVTSLPNPLDNVLALSAVVGGNGVVRYAHKVGADSSTDCFSSSGYGPLTPVGTPITDVLSAVPDGDVELCVLAESSDGTLQELTTAFSYIWSKDTTAPSSESLLIDGGAATTSVTAVTLSLAATGANQMFVTNTAGCQSGGVWEAYSSSRAWVLAGTDSLQTVYVKFRDAAGNETTCTNDSITHVNSAVLDITGADPYDFGVQAYGGSVSNSFTVTNSGSGTATAMTPPALTAPFSYVGGTYPGSGGDCGATLASGASCTLQIQYAPTSGSVHNDTIDLSYYNGSAVVNTTKDIQGTANAPANLTISMTDPYNYGTSAVGSISQFTFTVTNTGSLTATGILESGLAAPFSVSGGTCTATLAPAANCTLVVDFSPAMTGAAADTIQVDYFDGAAAQNASRAVQGTGANPASILISGVNPYDYGNVSVGSPESHIFTINNTGDVSATALTELNLPDSNFGFSGGVFPGVGGSCGATLAAASNCTIEVIFNPASTSAFNATVDISYNNGVNAQNSTLDVTGVGVVTPPLNFLGLGNEQSCGKDLNGDAFCWGRGGEGQLGSGGTSDEMSAVAVSGGSDWVSMDSFTRTVCGVDTSNNGYCWGDNTYGQVGDSSNIDRSVATPLLSPGTWQKIEVGNGFACGLKTNGDIYCWGRNNSGQLGDGTTTNRMYPVLISGGGTYVDVAAGGFTACGILSGGSVQCWGQGNSGQMGNSTVASTNTTPVNSSLATDTYTQIAVGNGHVCAVTTTNFINCWGKGGSGQLGNGTSNDHWNTLATVAGSGWTKVEAGNSHTCALKFGTNELHCWGSGLNGQLGNGATTGTNTPYLVGVGYADVFAGYDHNCGIQTDNSLWCWGKNGDGQLGDGSTIDSTNPINVNP